MTAKKEKTLDERVASHKDDEMQALEHSINRDITNPTDEQKAIIAALDADDKAGVVAGILAQAKKTLEHTKAHLDGLFEAALTLKTPSIRSAMLMQEIMLEVGDAVNDTAMNVVMKRTMGPLGLIADLLNVNPMRGMRNMIRSRSETIVADTEAKKESLKELMKLVERRR